jgi:glucosylceramidase
MNRLAFLLALCSTALIAQAQQVTVVQTTPDLQTPMRIQSPLHFQRAQATTSPTITVNGAKKYQTIDGFGASLTDSSAWLLYTKLAPEQRDETMRALFDPQNGIGVSMLRQPMGASDLALNDYSYDDMPKGQSDPGLEHFSIAHDNAYVLPSVRDAIKLNSQIKVIATPWSPPGWMKTSDALIGGEVKPSAYPELADYFVKFINAYTAAGVPIYGLTMQNEPLYVPNNYTGMSFPPEEQAKFLGEHLGPALEKANLHPKVMVYDHNWDHPEFPTTVLSDAAASKYAAGVAWHCYGGEADAQSEVHNKFPNKDAWLTECSGGTWQKGNLLADTAGLIIRSTRNWAKSVILWNIALDQHHGPNTGGCDVCRGFVTVDTSKTPAEVTRTVDYYAIGQVSKFVHPGAVRVDTNSFEKLENVAFLNPDGSIALLVLNTADDPLPFVVNSKGSSFSYTLAAGSVVTFTWKQ